jgi:hypothetical protein
MKNERIHSEQLPVSISKICDAKRILNQNRYFVYSMQENIDSCKILGGIPPLFFEDNILSIKGFKDFIEGYFIIEQV